MSKWLWYAWVERSGGIKQPFYGLWAPSSAPPQAQTVEDVSLPSGAVLKIAQVVLSEADAGSIDAILDGSQTTIDVSAALSGAPPLEVKFSRQVITDAFGHLGIVSRVFYGMSDLNALAGSEDDLFTALNACTKRLGLPLKKELATHLGGFDCFEMRPWVERAPPYEFDVIKHVPQPHSDGVRIWRADASAEEVARLVLRSDGEIVFDRAAVLRAGTHEHEWQIQTMLDWMDLSLYRTSDGALTYRESNHFIREIGMTIATPGDTMILSDDLAKRAAGDPALRDRASRRAVMKGGVQSMVGLDPSKLRAFSKVVQNRFLGFDVNTADRWFPQGVAGELAAIDYLNELIGRANVQEAILVDPFFGFDAIDSFVMRVSSGHRKLIVVASWARHKPDTRDDDEQIDWVAEELDRLEKKLDLLRKAFVPRFEFINLTQGRNQAFHDRYLLTTGAGVAPKAFLLSNSINGMSRNWPFCVSELHGEALRKVAAYIQELVNGKDITGAAHPTINFRWPKPTNSSAGS